MCVYVCARAKQKREKCLLCISIEYTCMQQTVCVLCVCSDGVFLAHLKCKRDMIKAS